MGLTSAANPSVSGQSVTLTAALPAAAAAGDGAATFYDNGTQIGDGPVPLTTASDAHRLSDVASRTADLARMLEVLDVGSLRAFRARRAVDVPVATTVSGS